ncbi:MAG: acyltransferase [Paludibacteraceae bacterium]|nr:acyltransferase [Paludibacteraceae bacterium]
MEDLNHHHWDGDTDGTGWMQRSLLWMTQGPGLWLFYGIVAVVVCFYILLRPRDTRAIYRLHRRLGRNRLHAAVAVYGNFFQFGCVIMDRFSAYGGRKFDIRFDEREAYTRLLQNESGIVQLSSHVGNYEMAGYSLPYESKEMYALVYSGETETVMENRRRIFQRHHIRMVPVKEDLSHLFILNDALEHGNTASLPADRVFGSPKYFSIPFLGRDARFPKGPFALAVKRQVPVVAMFVLKQPHLRYSIHYRELRLNADESLLPAAVQMRRLAEKYTVELEKIVRAYPSQWFNFFDFWM